MAKIRIAIVEDHEIVREGLRAALGAEPDMEVVGDVGAGTEAVALVQRTRPDILLLDIKLGVLEGPEVCRQVLDVAPRTSVVMLTSYAQEALLVRSLAAGAKGYIVKDVELTELKRMLRLVYRGNSVLDPKITAHVIHTATNGVTGMSTAARAATLSEKDLAIVRYLSDGMTNKEIAARVHLSPHTVKDRLEKLRDTFGARTRAQLVTRVLMEGLIQTA